MEKLTSSDEFLSIIFLDDVRRKQVTGCYCTHLLNDETQTAALGLNLTAVFRCSGRTSDALKLSCHFLLIVIFFIRNFSFPFDCKFQASMLAHPIVNSIQPHWIHLLLRFSTRMEIMQSSMSSTGIRYMAPSFKTLFEGK